MKKLLNSKRVNVQVASSKKLTGKKLNCCGDKGIRCCGDKGIHCCGDRA